MAIVINLVVINVIAHASLYQENVNSVLIIKEILLITVSVIMDFMNRYLWVKKKFVAIV